jgi:hypothetical protein
MSEFIKACERGAVDADGLLKFADTYGLNYVGEVFYVIRFRG